MNCLNRFLVSLVVFGAATITTNAAGTGRAIVTKRTAIFTAPPRL